MLLFAVTIFLSAFLLFQLQPVIAKAILPWFGGTAAVWATCLLFFQMALLGGYFYSHVLIRRLKPRQQWLLHAALLLLALALLPIVPNAAWKPTGAEAPTLRILGLLAATVGLPYFLCSTTGPLIQAWYAQANPGSSPYRLYALSNLGSMLALLTYPVLVEPVLTLKQQAWTWSGGFVLFALLCAYTGFRATRQLGAAKQTEEPEDAGAPPTRLQYLLWIALAAAPSMLLLSLTSHMTQDLVPIPFLWVLPLALYLLSFILTFDAAGWYRRVWFLGALPVALALLTWLMGLPPDGLPNIKLVIALYATSFFVACMVCHGELSRLKPHPRYLTGFFLMLSIGGAVGGVFVALVAPYLFHATFELPISIALVALLALAVLYLDRSWPFRRDLLGWPSIGALSAAALVVGFAAKDMRDSTKGHLLITRNFYGELKVTQYNNVYEWDGYRTLVHGAINHGEEYTHPARRNQAATYYCPDTALGRLMLTRDPGTPQRVAIIGLGTGTLAAYSRMGDLYRFYDINPKVEEIAKTYFWYLKTAEGLPEVVLGDARLSLEREEPQDYDTIVVDAFSSDSIPVHLLTREAFQLYFRHLKPKGVLAVHISNRFIDLRPVVERGATALGKKAWVVETNDDSEGRCYGTTWVLVTADGELFSRPAFQGAGAAAEPAPWLRPWTDDFSNIYKVLR